ncbi:MAG: hypothetical protein JWP08_1414 [Bryobacterales bacterium]|nr:hypothetical protein [Bryobacterales bacterium]
MVGFAIMHWLSLTERSGVSGMATQSKDLSARCSSFTGREPNASSTFRH